MSDAVWKDTPAVVKSAMVQSAVGEVGRSVNEAAALGGFDHPKAHLTRGRLTLDQPGWDELSAALMKLVAHAERIQAESAHRLHRTDHLGERETALVMMMFESMPSIEGRPEPGDDPAHGSRQRGAAPARASKGPS